jgi:type IV pilus assembly protein PilP
LKPQAQKRGFFLAAVALPLASIALCVAACGGGEVEGDKPGPAAGAPRPPASSVLDGGNGHPPAAAAQAAAGADAGAAPDPRAKLPPLPLREFQERDFSETDQSRDPFRSFAPVFAQQAQTRLALQRKVLVERYALDELKLVGIVNGSPSRALLTDPGNLGWVCKVGDFVGKAEIVHAGGPTGTDVAVNWRVDRIREGDVVFIREDPSHPEIPPTTRVVSLRTPEEEAGQKHAGR